MAGMKEMVRLLQGAAPELEWERAEWELVGEEVVAVVVAGEVEGAGEALAPHMGRNTQLVQD